MQFEFATANRIVFGAGTRRQAAPAAAQLGNRALIVTGVSGDFVEALLEELAQAGVAATRFVVSGEPTTAVVQAGVAQARAAGCDLVIGLGGGSALDTGKAIAALLTNGGEPLDYLEVVGRGQPLTRPSAPLIALPTTAGTGAEVTRNAVLAVPERRVKVSLRSPGMLPTLAIVDPELTYSLPPRPHRQHRARRAHASAGAVRFFTGQSPDRWNLPRGAATRRPFPAARLYKRR
jgi:alcohol dehydrogenase class IV